MSENVSTTPPRLLTSTQLAAFLQCSRDNVKHLCKRDGFPKPFRLSPRGKILFDEAEVVAWLRTTRSVGGPSDAA